MVAHDAETARVISLLLEDDEADRQKISILRRDKASEILQRQGDSSVSNRVESRKGERPAQVLSLGK